MHSPRRILLVFVPLLLVVVIVFGIRAFQFSLIFSSSEAPSLPELDLIPILQDDPIIGDVSAPHTIIAFEDFGCEGCRTQMAVLNQVMEAHPGSIKIIWKGLPVTRFPIDSEPAHRHAYCAHKQEKFDAFKDIAFANGTNLSSQTLLLIGEEIELDTDALSACLASEGPQQHIQKVEQLATLLQIQAVPAVFVDNTQINAPTTVTGWEDLFDL